MSVQAVASNYSARWERFSPREQLFVHRWQPEAPKATVAIVHGLGEHGGRYSSLADSLVELGHNVVAFDQQGHGKHPGRRGCVRSYPSMLDDIHQFLMQLRSESDGQPLVLFGHSMGGNLVLNYSLRYKMAECDAVIASSPMIVAAREIPGWYEATARVMRMFFPNYRIESEAKVERLMSDPEEQQRFLEDDLFHAQLSLRLAQGLLDSGRWLLKNARRTRRPTYIFHGTYDSLTSPDASLQFSRRAGRLCEFDLLDNHLHDCFRDIGRDAVIAEIDDYIERVLLQ